MGSLTILWKQEHLPVGKQAGALLASWLSTREILSRTKIITHIKQHGILNNCIFSTFLLHKLDA
jgi:hypothetical protein